LFLFYFSVFCFLWGVEVVWGFIFFFLGGGGHSDWCAGSFHVATLLELKRKRIISFCMSLLIFIVIWLRRCT